MPRRGWRFQSCRPFVGKLTPLAGRWNSDRMFVTVGTSGIGMAKRMKRSVVPPFDHALSAAVESSTLPKGCEASAAAFKTRSNVAVIDSDLRQNPRRYGIRQSFSTSAHSGFLEFRSGSLPNTGLEGAPRMLFPCCAPLTRNDERKSRKSCM